MDKTTDQLVTFVAEFDDSMIRESVHDAALRHILDTVACAVAGYNFEAARIARNVAKMAPHPEGATIVGDTVRVIPEMAAFANTTTVRITEWNDGMFAQGGGHASEMIPAILAVGEVSGSSPRDALLAIVLAYELLGGLGKTFYRRQSPFGQGTFACPAAALAIGKLIGLDRDQLASAMAHALLTVPLSADHGQRSTISKGSSVAKAMKRAIFAVYLAREGMVAAPEPFEGHHAFWSAVPPEFARSELTLPAIPDGPMVIEMAYMKRYPSEAHSQALLGYVLSKIRPWSSAEELESFDIESYWHANESLGREKGVWDPKNRPTADHSMPYLLSRALVDGELTLQDSFTPEKIADLALRPIMEKFTMKENDDFTANYRPPGMEIMGNPIYRVIVRRKDGAEFREDVTFPPGHYHNPMAAADINAKFDDACRGIVNDERKEQIRSAWWNFDKAVSLADLMATLQAFD